MHFDEVVRRRRMTRSFAPDPLDERELDELLDGARRGPTAGNSQGLDLVVLEGPGETSGYWDVTLPSPRRERFAWPGLLRAPVLVLVVASPDVYIDRYGEPDKVGTGRGAGPDAWPVPFWFVDGGAAVMALLYGATARGLGALLFGVFDHEADVRRHLGIPPDRRIVATVALGHPDGADRPGRSAERERRPLDQVVHRGRW